MLEGCLSSFHDAGARGVEHTDAVAGCRWWLSCWTRGELHEGSPDKWLCEREKSVESNAATAHAGEEGTWAAGAGMAAEGARAAVSPAVFPAVSKVSGASMGFDE